MRIKKLILKTSNIERLKSFYVDVLSFNLRVESPTILEFQIGSSRLVFQESPNVKPYHFAFNIPPQQIQEALHWLKSRVSVLEREGQEIIHFESWRARAIYFHDPDGNILEFIARKELECLKLAAFSQNTILGISEIGIPSADNARVHDYIIENFGLALYSGTRHQFCALGDAEGLFICINPKERKWFPLGEDAFISDFDVEFSVGKQNFRMKYLGGYLS